MSRIVVKLQILQIPYGLYRHSDYLDIGKYMSMVDHGFDFDNNTKML